MLENLCRKSRWKKLEMSCLSPLPWISRRPPSWQSFPKWRRCGRRRAPHWEIDNDHCHCHHDQPTQVYLTPSACEVMLVPCALLLAAMIRNVPNRRTSKCCNTFTVENCEIMTPKILLIIMMPMFNICKGKHLWVGGKRSNKPANSLKLSFCVYLCIKNMFFCQSIINNFVNLRPPTFILWTGSVMFIESKRAASFSGPKIPPGIWKEPFQAKNLTFCTQAEEY